MSIFYFAYGSNMDQKRMVSRGCFCYKKDKGLLRDYSLIFNKRSKKDPRCTFANIQESKGSEVEGILYEIKESDINLLDKFEGYPKHYYRTELKIETGSSSIIAWVYIAQKEWISETESPDASYIQHLLEGKDYLSEEYYKKIRNLINPI